MKRIKVCQVEEGPREMKSINEIGRIEWIMD